MNSDVSIRRATYEDAKDMYTISLKAHQRSYDNLIPVSFRKAFDKRYTYSDKFRDIYQQRIQVRLDQPSRWDIFIAEFDGRVVGYTQQEYASPLYIQKRGLFVDPDVHGCGVGTALLAASIEGITSGTTIELHVIENNEPAKRLYEKFNFTYTPLADKTFYGAKLLTMHKNT